MKSNEPDRGRIRLYARDLAFVLAKLNLDESAGYEEATRLIEVAIHWGRQEAITALGPHWKEYDSLVGCINNLRQAVVILEGVASRRKRDEKRRR